MRRNRPKCAKAFAHLANWSYKSLPVVETAQITQVLDAMNRSEKGAAEKLLPLLYGELQQLAAARMAYEIAALSY